MNKITLSDGTVAYRYIEDCPPGIVVVTLVDKGSNVYYAHKSYISDPTAVDQVDYAPDAITDQMNTEKRSLGSPLPIDIAVSNDLANK